MFWLTPIIYDLEMVKVSLHPYLYWVYLLNPLSGCIDASRQTIMARHAPDPQSLGFAVVMSFLTLAVGLWIFSAKKKNFADRI